jgi:hypothetical protein
MMDWLDDLWDRLTDALVQVVRLRGFFALFTGRRLLVGFAVLLVFVVITLLLVRK